MSDSRIVKANEKMAEGITRGFYKIEDGVVGDNKKVGDTFMDNFLTHESESMEDAERRMETGKEMREET